MVCLFLCSITDLSAPLKWFFFAFCRLHYVPWFCLKWLKFNILFLLEREKKVLCILLGFYYCENNCKEIWFFKSVKLSIPKSNGLSTYMTSSKDGSFALILHALSEWNHFKIILLKMIPRSINTRSNSE